MSSVTIVIVSFNSEAVIADCLSPLLNDERCRAIIVDNGSSDHSAERLRKNFPAAEVIALDNNIGYGRAANCALKKIGTPYALLLNPDLKVSYDGVEKLLAHALNSPPEVAIWGPATSESDITDKAPQPVNWISGCAMLFNMEWLHKVGMFDENIFLFFGPIHQTKVDVT